MTADAAVRRRGRATVPTATVSEGNAEYDGNPSSSEDDDNVLIRVNWDRIKAKLMTIIILALLLIILMTTTSTRMKNTHSQSSASSSSIAVQEDDDLDQKLDFSGGGHMGTAYRLGDVFVAWHLIAMDISKLRKLYESRYPGTLATEYIRQATTTGDDDGKNLVRNLTALLAVMDRRILQNKTHYRRATPDELLVHVRLGDVLTDPEYGSIDSNIDTLWNADQGWVLADDSVKYNYNKAEFEELLLRLPRNSNKFTKCVIVGAKFLSKLKNTHREERYRTLVAEFLKERVGCQVSYYSSSNPDKDLLYMASAHYIITGTGGFSQLAAACVIARRGFGQHAIFDKFNGKIAGWNDPRFDSREKALYGRTYVDWRRVKYTAPEAIVDF